ncbi:MAG: methyltransferase domain-containing protein [Candidatus Hodarchaeales archaeon]|jgi:predicted RNA methylase
MKNIKKFSKKSEFYHKYRWRYPAELIDLLVTEINLQSTSSYKIADIGSGTGLLSEVFLKNKNTVFSVEPNTEMWTIAENIYLDNFPNFVSITGTAEKTNLQETVDMITAGMSFFILI